MHPASHGSIASLLPFSLNPHLFVPIFAGFDVLAAIAITVVVLIRAKAQRRALSRRAASDLLPATSFDPKDEDVRRFARQLQRLGAAPSLFTPRRAAGVRIRLHTGTTGRLTYRIEGPHAVGNLALQAYPGIELRAVKPEPAAHDGHEPQPENQTEIESIQDGAPA